VNLAVLKLKEKGDLVIFSCLGMRNILQRMHSMENTEHLHGDRHCACQ
jgi:hypothetical protein